MGASAFGDDAMGASASQPVGISPPHCPEMAVLPPASPDSITSFIFRGEFFSAELAGLELQRRLNRRQHIKRQKKKKRKKEHIDYQK